MNDLINKYQDDEITQSELQRLHKAVESSDYIRHKMTTASLLNDYVKIDKKKMEMPEEFFDEVEDIIMMKYLQDVPEEETAYIIGAVANTNRLYSIVRYSMKYAAAVVILFFASLFTISEFDIFNQIQSIQLAVDNLSAPMIDYADESTEMLAEPLMVVAIKAPREVKSAIVPETTTMSNDVVETIYLGFTSDVVVSSVTTSSPAEDDNLAANILDTQSRPTEDYVYSENEDAADGLEIDEPFFIEGNFKSSFTLSNSKSLLNASMSNLMPIRSQFEGPLSLTDNWGISDGAKLSLMTNSAYGAFMLGGDINKEKPVVAFSQSIGFVKNESRHSAGLEFGFHQISLYTYETVVIPNAIPKPISPNNDETQSEGGGSSTNITMGRNGTVTKIRVDNQVSLLFTNVFYEYDMIRTTNTSLTGRLGIGFCGRELLGVAKLYGRQRLYNNIFLTLGVENRTFGIDVLNMQGEDYISMFNVLYGVQFVF